jgi:hypothetical protein
MESTGLKRRSARSKPQENDSLPLTGSANTTGVVRLMLLVVGHYENWQKYGCSWPRETGSPINEDKQTEGRNRPIARANDEKSLGRTSQAGSSATNISIIPGKRSSIDLSPLASFRRALWVTVPCEIRQHPCCARSRYGQETSSACKVLSETTPKDGDGNHVHNQILLDMPLKEREMLFPKLELVENSPRSA